MVTLDKRHNEQPYNAETAFSSSSDLELGDENPIFSLIWKQRKGQYCHALEIEHVEELKSSIEALCDELGERFNKKHYVTFFKTLELYALNDECEDEIHSFDIEQYINTLVNW